MNPTVKSLWLTALRQPHRKQAQDRLYDEQGGMCVFGVLCDVYKSVTGKGQWVTHPPYFELNGEHHPFVLPTEIAKWADLTLEQHGLLARMNDGTEPDMAGRVQMTAKSFAEIADFIENKL